MSPICSPFGGWSYLNRAKHPDSWEEHVKYALTLGVLCGETALQQDQDGLDWLNEQPASSDLYSYDPWPRVCANPKTVKEIFDQRQCKARSSKGRPIKKPIGMTASHPALVKYFVGLKCGAFLGRCNGDHDFLMGDETEKAKVWP